MRCLSLAVLFLFLVLPCFAECTAEQWKTDLDLYQKYLSATPKDYLGAINLNRKWIGYAKTDPAKAAKATGGMSTDKLQANLNNVYREVAKVLVDDYGTLLQSDPLKAAQLGLDVWTFFREHPDIMREFASANGTTPKAMQKTMVQAVRQGFLKTWEAMAKQYSALIKAGKTDDAAKLSAAWESVISDLEAHDNKLPDQFRRFTGVDITKVVADVKAFETDLQAYNDALAKGEFAKALELVAKWESYAKSDPAKMNALNFIYNAEMGVKPGDKGDWAKTFADIRAQVYAAMFKADVKAYEAAIADGRLADAKALVAKWKGIIAGPLGEAIAALFDLDAKTFLANLDKERLTLDGVDPSVASESVASFKVDLAEYEACVKAYQAAKPGSDAWYKDLARAAELADKWSRIARENPALAAEIKKATGIELPKAADDVIRFLLDTAITDSAAQFNAAMGAGNYQRALDWVKAWKEYLAKHPRVNELAVEKWGKDFPDLLDRYEKGLTTIIGGPTAADSSATAPADASGAPAVDTTGSDAGLGGSAQ